MDKYLQHQNQLNRTTIALQKEWPGFRFFPRHVGKFYSPRIFQSLINVRSMEELKQYLFAIKKKYMVSINKPGMSDQFIVAPIEINGKMVPVHIEMETKTGSGRLNPDQINWKKRCEIMHVKFIEARNIEQVKKEIRDYIKELQS